MASFEKFAEEVGKGDLVSAYTNVLKDLNYCINLFEDLEIGRTEKEIWFDYYAGERDQINLEDLPENLEVLKKEIELGLQLYMKLSCKMKILNTNQSSQDSKQQSIIHSDKITHRWGIQQELRNQFEDLLSTIADIKTPEKVQSKVVIYGYTIPEYIPGVTSYRERKILYNGANILYQTLNQKNVLSVLKENHTSIRELIECIDDAIRNVNIPRRYNPSYTFGEDNVTSQQRNSPENTEGIDSISDTVLNPEHNSPIENTKPLLHSDNSNPSKSTNVRIKQPEVTESADSSHNPNLDIDDIDLARAKDEYNVTLDQERDELYRVEKGIHEETALGMAKRAAARSCKRFLKEGLNFSNSKADRCIRIIQDSSNI